MGPASVLAHGGGDSYAFCDDECDWIDGDWDGARAAREREVHVGHGGGSGGVVAGEGDDVYGMLYEVNGDSRSATKRARPAASAQCQFKL